MSDESQKHEELIREAFRQLYPLTPEELLPWYPTHIPEFLRDRLKRELSNQVEGFIRGVSRILLDVTPPKTHMVDMARKVVTELKALRQFRDSMLADANVNLDRQVQDLDQQHWRDYLLSVQKRACRTLEQ